MATLRESYQAADEDEDYGDQDYDAMYGFAPGPGHGEQGPMNIATGGGSYDAPAQESYTMTSGPDKSSTQIPFSGWEAGGSPSPSSVQGSQPSNLQFGAANSAANYPVSWATPYSQVQKSSGASTGIKSGISTTTQKPLATVQTSKTVFPTGTKFPEFKGPAWDEKEIRKRASKAAAPGIAALEMKVQQAMARYYENPNVRRMVLRDTLAGYGIGLANVRAQASQTAGAEYSRDYARLYTEAMGDYQRDLAKIQLQGTQVSSQQQVYTQAEYDKLTGGGDKVDTIA